MGRSKLRIAIIGCGAATEFVHLPALAKIGVRPVLLVDKNLQRAEALAHRFHIARVGEDYLANQGEFDAAIVAVPHHIHARVTLDLLENAVHVLVEKPMAMTFAEAQEMESVARRTESVLAVGMLWHFTRAHQWVKGALQAGLLGKIESFDFQEGLVFDWPIVSNFTFVRETGGGVLLDTGSHVLDVLIWWLGEVSGFTYTDDSLGGVEANSEMTLTLANGAKGFVALSRTRNLRNTATIKGTQGEIEVGLSIPGLQVNPSSLQEFKTGRLKGNRLGTQSKGSSSELQLRDWINSIETGRVPSVTGADTARSIALMENMRAQRETSAYPWLTVDTLSGMAVEARKA